MHIVANDSEFDIDENTSLLQALRQHGIAASFSCRNGNCGLCEAHLNAGRVWLDDKQQLIDAPTTLLLCRAFARCDLNLKIDITSRAVSRYCRVLRVEQIAQGYEVELQLPAGRVPVLSPDDFVRLEGDVGARLLKPLVALSENLQRKLILQLRDDDREWLVAVNKGGVRIELLT
jgi:ferredoxin